MYALDADSGDELWTTPTIPAPGAPFGPIVSSAAVADATIDGQRRRLVIFGAGPRLYALDAEDGSVVWVFYAGANAVDVETTELVGQPTYPDEQTEFESSPVVWEGVVYIGMDVHNRPVEETGGVRGGVWAFDLVTGEPLRFFTPDLDGQASGCSSVWSSPALDVRDRTLFLATGNCPHDDHPWTPHTEAVTALDLDGFAVRWTFQPEPSNRDDTDFGATPNLFLDRAGDLVLGVGKKNAVYYALDPTTGEVRWQTQVAEPGNVQEDFAVGGFIGSSATGEGHVYGGTALGGPPYFHALDGRNGTVRWNGLTGPTYAASATVNGVVVGGALDGLVRAWDGETGRQLWAAPTLGPVSGGPAIVGDRVYVTSGTSSSDLCAKDAPGSELCFAFFDETLGASGGIQAFEVVNPGTTAAVGGAGDGAILLGGEGDRLRAWDLTTLEHQIVVRNAPDVQADTSQPARRGQREGMNVNAQICPFPDGSGRFIAGEDTGQGDLGVQGWGVFRLEGSRVGGLEAELTAKLAPTFVTGSSNPENYGCGFLADGRALTTDVGDQFPGQPATGQLIVWFPPFDSFDVPYCKVDVGIPTAGGILVEDDTVYVASNRGAENPADGAIYRYAGAWPTGPGAAGGCGRTDATGAALVDEGRVAREVFIAAGPEALTPSAIVASGRDTFYVSSVFSGTIAEYDRQGTFLRSVLRPVGPPSQTTGTPFGLAVGDDGTLYYADLGIVLAQPAPGAGSVRRIRFDADGDPLAPEVLRAGLSFPDGVGIVTRGTVLPAPPTPGAPSGQPRPATPATGGGAALAAAAFLVGAGRSLRRRR
jgi:polyvinyl alcohol dehydrogenase (cytochrome)